MRDKKPVEASSYEFIYSKHSQLMFCLSGSQTRTTNAQARSVHSLAYGFHHYTKPVSPPLPSSPEHAKFCRLQKKHTHKLESRAIEENSLESHYNTFAGSYFASPRSIYLSALPTLCVRGYCKLNARKARHIKKEPVFISHRPESDT